VSITTLRVRFSMHFFNVDMPFITEIYYAYINLLSRKSRKNHVNYRVIVYDNIYAVFKESVI
jgi:hypothetical protein